MSEIAYPADQEDGLEMPSFLVRNKPAEQQQPEQGDASAETPSKKSWRDILPVHPACAAFPDMPHDELVKLGDDIKQNGLKQPIIVLMTETDNPKEPTYELLDGKNRLAAMEAVAVDFKIGFTEPNRRGAYRRPYLIVPLTVRQQLDIEIGLDDDEVKTLVRSLNEHRRHLTAEDKRKAIENLLKLDPTRSDRQIAKAVDASPTHVGKIRKQAEERGDVSTVDTRKDTKGRKQPAKKAKPKPTAAEIERDHETCIALNQKAIEAEKAKAQWLADHSEAARIESEQLDNVLKDADFGADVVVESPSIVMTSAGPRPVPSASDEAEGPLDVLCAEWARSSLKSRFDALEATDQFAFLSFLRNAIVHN